MGRVLRQQARLKFEGEKKGFDEMTYKNQKQSQINDKGRQNRKVSPVSGKINLKLYPIPQVKSKCWEKMLWRRVSRQKFVSKIHVPHRTGQYN